MVKAQTTNHSLINQPMFDYCRYIGNLYMLDDESQETAVQKCPPESAVKAKELKKRLYVSFGVFLGHNFLNQQGNFI